MKSNNNKEDTRKYRQQLVGIALIILIAVFVFLVVATKENNASKPNKVISYENSMQKISFNYPSEFSINDASHSNEKIKIIEISPKRRAVNQYGSEFIEIFSYPTEKDKSAKEVGQDFLQSNRQDNFSFLGRKDIDSAWYVQTTGLGERSYYSFFKKDHTAIVAIFRSRHFDRANPLIMVDNSRYLQGYMEIINSLKLYSD